MLQKAYMHNVFGAHRTNHAQPKIKGEKEIHAPENEWSAIRAPWELPTWSFIHDEA